MAKLPAEEFIEKGFKEGDVVTKDGGQFRLDPTGELIPVTSPTPAPPTPAPEVPESEITEGEKSALEKIAEKETDFLTSEETDMDKFFEERKKSIEEQKGRTAGVASPFERRIAEEEAGFEQKREDVLAGLRGVGPATYNAVVSRLEKEHKLIVNDLMSRKEEALANFNNGLAERYDNLIVKQYEFQTQARKDAFARMMDVTQEQRAQRGEERQEKLLTMQEEAIERQKVERKQEILLGYPEAETALKKIGKTVDTVSFDELINMIRPIVTKERQFKLDKIAADIKQSEILNKQAREQTELVDVNLQLQNAIGPGGFVDINRYFELRATSTLKPDQFDLRFLRFLSEADRGSLSDLEGLLPG